MAALHERLHGGELALGSGHDVAVATLFTAGTAASLTDSRFIILWI